MFLSRLAISLLCFPSAGGSANFRRAEELLVGRLLGLGRHQERRTNSRCGVEMAEGRSSDAGSLGGDVRPKTTGRVLLVDDSPLVRDFVGGLIDDWGFAVETFATAKAALEALTQRRFGRHRSGPEHAGDVRARVAHHVADALRSIRQVIMLSSVSSHQRRPSLPSTAALRLHRQGRGYRAVARGHRQGHRTHCDWSARILVW